MNEEHIQDGPLVSVLICTYNRADILDHCLASLTRQTAPADHFEVIVVDNRSTDHTRQLVEQYAGQYPNIRYVSEPVQGHSQARNRAYHEARSEWLLYLDDDARVDPDLVSGAIKLANDYPYDIYGGIIQPWYLYGRPHWYRDHYVEKDWSGLNKVSLQKSPSAYAKGCLMLIRKSYIDRCGEFSTQLGMVGNSVGYSDEVELQHRLRKAGAQLAFAPHMRIHHLVAPYKMKLAWFFRAAFAQGRNNVDAKAIPPTVFQIMLISLTAVAMLLAHLLWYTPQLLRPDYYFENWAHDVFRKIAKRAGTVYTLMTRRSQDLEVSETEEVRGN